MKKRNVIYGLLALFCTFVLAGCQGLPGLPGQGGLDIGDIAIEGVEDVKIDTNLNQIRFEVKSTVDSFDVKSIKAPENVTGVYCVDGNGNKLQDMLALSEGENRFTLVFEAGEAKATWTLTIKRLTKEEENKKVASIEVTDYVKDYFVGDKFKGGAIKVTYLDGTVKNLPITLDLLAGFDTKTPGEHEVTVAYKGAVTAITITVKERVVLSSIELKEAETSYFINDSFKGATITLKYSDNTTKDVIATEEMLSGFDTATSGSKVVTITYEGKSCEFTINVIEVTAIKLDNAKLSYLVGDEFESFEAVVEYSDGKKENITVTKDMVAGFDTKVVGIKRVKLSYLNKEVSYDITVRELTEITLKSAEVNYELGDDLKATVITLHYTDGKNITTKDVNVTKEMLSGFDTATSGSKVVTITYEGKTCEFTINVKKPVVMSGIEMKSFESQYLENEEFKGAIINILFSNDTKKEYVVTADMLEGFMTNELGEHIVTVKYGEFTAEFTINVSPRIVLTEISLNEAELSYEVGDSFKSATINAVYSDGTTKIIDVLESMLTGFNTSKAGSYEVTITYEGKTCSFTIVVSEPIRITGIEMKSFESKYHQNEEFKGAIINVLFSDSSIKEINVTKEMLQGFDTNKLGKHTVTVTYGDFTNEFIINVSGLISIEIKNAETEYNIGDDLKPTAINATYSDGTNQEVIEINVTKEMLSGFDTTASGSKVVTITYEGKTCEFTINVKKPSEITGIEMKSFESEYYQNEDFKGAVINILISDGTMKEYIVTADMLEGFITNELGEHIVTVKYGEFTAEFTINVSKKAEEIIADDFVIIYYLNQEFKSTKINVSYSDGTNEVVDLDISMLQGFSTAKAGNKLVTISYKGLELEKTIIVYNEQERLNAIKDVLASFNSITKIEFGSDVNASFDILYKEALKRIEESELLKMRDYLDSIIVTNEQLASTSAITKNEGLELLKIFYRVDINKGPEALFEILATLTTEDITYIQSSLLKAIDIFSDKQIANLFVNLVNDSNNQGQSEKYRYYNEILQKYVEADLVDIIKIFGSKPLENYLLFTEAAVKINEADAIMLVNAFKQVIRTIAKLDTADILAVVNAVVNFDGTIANTIDGIHALGRIVNAVIANKAAVDEIGSFCEKYAFASLYYGIEEIFVDNFATNGGIKFIVNNIGAIATYLENVKENVLKAIDVIISWASNGEEPADLDNSLVLIASEVNALLDEISSNGINDKYIALWLCTTGLDFNQILVQLNIIRECATLDSKNLKPEDKEKLRSMVMGFKEVYSKSNYRSKEIIIDINSTYSDLIALFNSELKEYLHDDLLYAGMPATWEFVKSNDEINEILKTKGLYRIEIIIKNDLGSVIAPLYIMVVDGTENVHVKIYNDTDRLKLVYLDQNAGFLGFGDLENKYMYSNNINVLLEDYSYVDLYFENYNLNYSMNLKNIYLDSKFEVLPADEIGLAQWIINTTYGEARIVVQYTILDLDNPKIEIANALDGNRLEYGNELNEVDIIIGYGYKRVSYSLDQLGINVHAVGKQTAKFMLDGKEYSFEVEVISKEQANLSFVIDSLEYINIDNLEESFKNDTNMISIITGNMGNHFSYNRYLRFLNSIYNSQYKSFHADIELYETYTNYAIVKITTYGDTTKLREDYVRTNVITAEQYEKIDLRFDDYNNENIIEMTDEEFLQLKNTPAEELDAMIKEALNNSNWGIYSRKYGNYYSYDSDLFDVLNKLAISYLIEKDLTDDYLKFRIIALDDTFIEMAIYRESYNRSKLNGIELINNNYRNYTDAELDSSEKLLCILVNDFSLKLKYLAPIILNRDTLREYLIAHPYTIEHVIDNYGNHKLVLSINGYNSSVSIDIFNIDKINVEVKTDPNSKLGSLNPTIDEIQNLIYRNIIKIYINGELEKSLEIASIDNTNVIVDGMLNIQITVDYRGFKIPVSFDMGFYTENDYQNITNFKFSTVFVKDILNPTIDEVLSYAKIFINGEVVMNPDINAIKKNYEFTLEKDRYNDKYLLSIKGINNQESWSSFITIYSVDDLNKISYIEIRTKNIADVNGFGTINIVTFENSFVDPIELIKNNIIYIDVHTLGGTNTSYISEAVPGFKAISDFFNEYNVAITEDEYGFYNLKIADLEVNIMGDKFKLMDTKYLSYDPIINFKNENSYIESENYYISFSDDLSENGGLQAFKNIVDSISYLNSKKERITIRGNQIDEFIKNAGFIEYVRNENDYSIYTVSILSSNFNYITIKAVDNPNTIIETSIEFAGTGRAYTSVVLDDILNEISFIYVKYANGTVIKAETKEDIKKYLPKYNIYSGEKYFEIRFDEYGQLLKLLKSTDPNLHIVGGNNNIYSLRPLTLDDVKYAINRDKIDISLARKSKSGEYKYIYLKDNEGILNTLSIISSELGYTVISFDYLGLTYKYEIKYEALESYDNLKLAVDNGFVSANPENATIEEAMTGAYYCINHGIVIGYTFEMYSKIYDTAIEKSWGNRYVIKSTDKLTHTVYTTNEFTAVLEGEKDSPLSISFNYYSNQDDNNQYHYYTIYSSEIKTSYNVYDLFNGLEGINISYLSGYTYINNKEDFIELYNKHPNNIILEKVEGENLYRLTLDGTEFDHVDYIMFVNENQVADMYINFNYEDNKPVSKVTREYVMSRIDYLDLIYLNGERVEIRDKEAIKGYATIKLARDEGNSISIRFAKSNSNLNLEKANGFKYDISYNQAVDLIDNENLTEQARNMFNSDNLTITMILPGDDIILEYPTNDIYQSLTVVKESEGLAKATFIYSGVEYTMNLRIAKAA